MVHMPHSLKLDAFTNKWSDPIPSQREHGKGVTMPNPLVDGSDSKYQSSFFRSWGSIPVTRSKDSIILMHHISNKHLDYDQLTAKNNEKRQNAAKMLSVELLQGSSLHL